MKKAFLLFLMGLLTAVAGFGDDSNATGSINGRIRRIAEQGNIVHPEEVIPNLYVGSIDYKYPEPEQNVGVYLYNNIDPMNDGREGVLQIGLQSKSQSFEDVPPLNMVLLVDASASMAAQIPRLRDSMELFTEKARPIDSISLVGFSDSASVLFPADFMDTQEKKRAFVDAVGRMNVQGGTNLEAGFSLAFEQALVNLNQDAVNIVVLVSDGTDLSARRREEGARSGDIRASLSWKTRNDLDLHVITPNGEHIYYGHKKDSTGGELDIDMNVNGETVEPIENIFWRESAAPFGTYRVFVQNFNFHGDMQNPTPFMVELKNGRSIQSFGGQIDGVGDGSAVEVCSFQYSGDEQAQTFQIIERYKENNVSISTLGIGDDFDADLMRALAEEARGVSRFLANSEILMDIFGSDVEFERLAIPSARNLTIELEFMSGVEILEADGGFVVENRLVYNAAVLNTGDYRTFLIRYRLPVFEVTQTVELVSLTLKAGEETIQEKTFVITLDASGEDPRAAYAGALLRFAENLKEIGEIYYQDKDQSAALQRTLESAAEIDAAKERLSKPFTDESFILSRYVGILSEITNESPPPSSQNSIRSTGVGTTSRRSY
jgi:Ca-activated chloride channel family protein